MMIKVIRVHISKETTKVFNHVSLIIKSDFQTYLAVTTSNKPKIEFVKTARTAFTK